MLGGQNVVKPQMQAASSKEERKGEMEMENCVIWSNGGGGGIRGVEREGNKARGRSSMKDDGLPTRQAAAHNYYTKN